MSEHPLCVTQSWWCRLVQSVRRDFTRKLIALFFALLVYFAGVSRISEEQTINDVPVEVILPAELVESNPKPILVSLKVRGSKRDLESKVRPAGRIEVKENDFVSGQSYKAVLGPENFRVANGVKVVAVDSNDQVQLLNLQRRLTKSVPVIPQLHGDPAPDYALIGAESVPSTVEVTGPERTINELRQIDTETIPLDASVTESFSYKAKLSNPQKLLLGVETVMVQVTVEKVDYTRHFDSLPVTVLATPEQLGKWRIELLDHQLADIDVEGPKKAVAALERRELRPYLDLAELAGEGEQLLPVQCDSLDSSVRVKTITPAQIKVKISKITVK